mgnify:CR=1 FL=1
MGMTEIALFVAKFVLTRCNVRSSAVNWRRDLGVSLSGRTPTSRPHTPVSPRKHC